jgi:hypothetical protein
MTFKEFITERVYNIPEKENNDIENIVNKYKNTFFKDSITKIKVVEATPSKFFKDKLDQNGRLPLGSIRVIDLSNNKIKKVKITVDFTKDSNSGEFFDETQEIVLYYYTLGFNLNKIRDVLTHEVLHAKQQYKETSNKYRKAIRRRKLPSGETTFRSNRAYYMDPVEFPVYTTLIIRQIISDYKESDKLQRSIIKAFLFDFIKSGGRPTNDSRAPEAVLDKHDFLKFLYKNRKNKQYRENYKNFIKKLYWLYGKLK